jgi:hypothetical protein
MSGLKHARSFRDLVMKSLEIREDQAEYIVMND